VSELFEIGKAPYLVAVGDGARLLVYRSHAVSKESPAYREVSDYIREHRMVLISAENSSCDGMLGQTECSHYATPEARMLWLSTHPEENR
jgi:hypothetical protein